MKGLGPASYACLMWLVGAAGFVSTPPSKFNMAPQLRAQRIRIRQQYNWNHARRDQLFHTSHHPEPMDILEECGPERLDELINNIQELELEVEGLRKEQGQDIVIGSCRFGREGSYKEPANEGRDLLLFLPGVDGLNIEAVDQFDYLSGTFDVWSLKVDGNDQSTFVELTERVLDFLSVVGVNEQRQAVIVGSSFGGLLAVNVALQDPQYVKGLVLVNPATSYERSHWRIVGSLVANAPGPEAFGLAAVLALATTIPDTAMFSKHLSELEALPPQELVAWFKSSTGEWLGRMLALFDKTPQHQLKWRLTHWLDEGSKVVEERLQELTLPVLVLAGSEDHMLPSAEEAARLYDLIPTCQQVVLRGVGHAALHNPGEVNLYALLKESVIYDDHYRDRIVSSKEAKKASKRWHEDKSGGDDLRRGEGVGDPVLDFKLDLDDRGVKMAWESTEMMDRFTSPVFFSVNEHGELNHGLGSVPDYQEGRSILFVGNHQLLGIDMPILVRKIFAEKNILVRGLAHPVVTGCGTGDLFETIKRQQESEETLVRRGNNVVLAKNSLGASGVTRPLASAAVQTVRATSRRIGSVVTACAKTVANGASLAHRVIKRDREGFDRVEGSASSPSISERVGGFMAKLGAVPVTPRNMLRLFKAGESMLLYPGGVKEALHQKGQDYQIFWPEKGEFVRMAASFNATIVPFAAVGSADSVALWMDLEEIFSLPFGVGEKMKDAADSIPRARQGDDLEYFLPPIARPKVPARHYFVFGPAIDTSLVDEKDRGTCQAAYELTKSCVHEGISFLLESRKQDPYRDGAKRWLYESVMKTQAPTFPLDAATFDSLRWPPESDCPRGPGRDQKGEVE